MKDGRDEPVIGRVTITNSKGLHARASAKLAALAGTFDATVTVRHGEFTASAAAIMDLLLLVAHKGREIELSATGPEAGAAVAALVALVEDGFGEVDTPENGAAG